MIVEKRTVRRMENLRGICDFDTKEGVAAVRIHYLRTEEILDPVLSRKGFPVINDAALSKLDGLLDLVPDEFRVKVVVDVEDCGGYSTDSIKQAYDRAILKADEAEAKSDRKKGTLMILFMVLGLVLLFAAVKAQQEGWFSFGGRALSMIFVVFIDVLFEVYFEEGIAFFTVSRGYRSASDAKYGRFHGLTVTSHK